MPPTLLFFLKITLAIWNLEFPQILGAALVAQKVENLPTMWETWVWSLGWEDLLEEGLATYSSILVWRIPIDRGARQSTGSQRVGHDWATKHTHTQILELFVLVLRNATSFKIRIPLNLWIALGSMIVLTINSSNPRASFHLFSCLKLLSSMSYNLWVQLAVSG